MSEKIEFDVLLEINESEQRKLFNKILPSSVCDTSGWNCVAILV